MLRTILGVIAGIVAAVLLMLGVEALATTLFPLPPGINPHNEADLARLVALAPLGMQALVVIGWALASLGGGWVAAKIARHPRGAALGVGLLIVAGSILNAVSIPHPLWMSALGVLLPVPLALLGARFAVKRPVRTADQMR